jgi:hypothetical protein
MPAQPASTHGDLKRLYKRFITLKQMSRAKSIGNILTQKHPILIDFHMKGIACETLEGKGKVERIRDHRRKRDARGENVCRKL